MFQNLWFVVQRRRASYWKGDEVKKACSKEFDEAKNKSWVLFSKFLPSALERFTLTAPITPIGPPFFLLTKTLRRDERNFVSPWIHLAEARS